MSNWLPWASIVIPFLVLIITLIQVWKRPKLEITPNSEKSYFYQKYQFEKGEIGEPIGTVLEFCLTIHNKGRGESKVKQFDIEIPDIGKSYIDIKHIERNAKGRIPSFRTCPTKDLHKGKTKVIPESNKILVNDSYIIRIAAHGRKPNAYLYFHIDDNIPEDKIECILKLKYGRRKAKAKFNLKRGNC